ncbi:putative Fungal specific transcription factor [Sclerotinia borealis F-4128]|uniref:Putative Fungal specific transcription factor n=1 Tax=Sclerotinia borealis (strain F-4128) TaxID=1432307 RepID=W9C499_SCLBF|nr:putative Fungal specific transcription factor [Sclerotinia borealis F-4128]
MSSSTSPQFAPENHQLEFKIGYLRNCDKIENEAENLTPKPSPAPCRRIFRRPRAGRACEMCHSRRVRCDAGSHGIPCTNCEALFLDCSIPPRKKNSNREGSSAGGRRKLAISIHRVRQPGPSNDKEDGGDIDEGKDDDSWLSQLFTSNHDDFASLILQADQHIKQQPDMAYLQKKSSLALLMKDYYGSAGAVHCPLSDDAANQHMATKINTEEMDILKKRGALQLPSRDVCEELIDAYFKWAAPVVSIINKSWFMQRWHDLENQPPLLLMQAILLAGSRVCTTSMLLDANGSLIPAATMFYKRAKALYDADYEEDRVIIVQALTLLGWYWEEPGVVIKNVFYWNGLAITIAQGFGMHRSPSGSRLSEADKRFGKGYGGPYISETVYHTTRCLLHRAYMPSVKSSSELHEKLDISQHAAFQSASPITTIIENLIARNELRYAPPFLIYSLLLGLIIHVYELQLDSPSTNTAAGKRFSICMSALEKLSDVWLVAKMVRGLFEAILQAAGFGSYTLDGTKRFKQIGEHKGEVWGLLVNSVTPSTTIMVFPMQIPPETHAKHQSASFMHHEDDFFLTDDLWATAAVLNPIPETVQYQDPTFPDNMNYIAPDQMIYWIQPGFQHTIPTTLDVADWFDYFGIR